MATGFHESTVALSVRNFLAVHGKAQVPLITKKLQALWLKAVDEREVKAALAALAKRKLVNKLKAGFFESTTTVVMTRTVRPKLTAKDRETAAWKWQPTGPNAFKLGEGRLDVPAR